MLSNELINYIENQIETERVSEVVKNTLILISSLKTLKAELSGRLPELFMEDDIAAIQECIDLGNAIDEFIDELSVLDFETPESIEDDGHKKEKTLTRNGGNGRKYENVHLNIVKNNICPDCGMKLVDSKTTYYRFSDRRKQVVDEVMTAATYDCPVCGGKFIHDQMLELLDLSKTNIVLTHEPEEELENRRASAILRTRKPVLKNNKPAPVKTVKCCVLCGQPACGDSVYCKDHLKYGKEENT